jgi:hypothetical protein
MSAHAPHPSAALLDARARLREQVLPRTYETLGLREAVVAHLATRARAAILARLGAVDPAHAGWTLLAAGSLLARSSSVPSGEGPSFAAGFAWSALVTGATGDGLLDAGERGETGEIADPAWWRPGPGAHAARRQASEMAASLRDVFSTPASRARLATDALDWIDVALPGLERDLGGWTVLTLAAWLGSQADDVAAPLTERRLLRRRRVPDPARAVVGCSFGGAMLAEIGDAILLRDRHPARSR